MTTGVIAPTPILQFFNNLGAPNVGGSILTQVGGINTATYQDSGLATPLPNPIPLNSRGEVSNVSGLSCQLFLTPGIVYVFTMFDANGNQLNQASYVTQPGSLLPAITNTFSLGSSTDSWAQLYLGPNAAPVLDTITGNVGYVARTAAEIATSVTPVDYYYPEGHLYRYGTNITPGTTDMTIALNTATSVCAYGKAVLQLPAGQIKITATWDCTANYTAPYGYPNNTNGGLTVIGAGMNSTVITYNAGANNAGIGWDMTGLAQGRFQGFSFVGGASMTNCPQVTLLQGAANVSSSFTPSLNNAFQEVQINGYGSYVIYNNGCEQQTFLDCTSVIYNTGASAVGWVFVASGSTPQVTSSLAVSWSPCRSMTVFHWFGAKAAMLCYAPVCILFHFNAAGACADIRFDDWFQALTPSGTAFKFMTDDSAGLAATGLFNCGSERLTLEGAAAGQTNYNVATFNCAFPKGVKFEGHAGMTSTTQYPFIFGPSSIPTDIWIDWDPNESGTFGATYIVLCQGAENGITVRCPLLPAVTTSGTINLISVANSRTIDGSPGFGFTLQGTDYAQATGMTITIGPETAGNFIRTRKVRAGTFVTENSDANEGVQVTASVSTSATAILALPNAGQLVQVTGVSSGGTKWYDVLAVPNLNSGTVAVLASNTVNGSPGTRTYTITSASLTLAMSAGTYAVQCTCLGAGMQV